MFDLKATQQSFSDVEQMEIKHPITGQGTGAYLHILNQDCSNARSAEMALRTQYVKDSQKNKGNNLQLLDSLDIDLINSLICNWHNVEEDGQAIDFSSAKMKQYLTDMPWLREQISAFAKDRGNFFKELPQN